MAKQSISDPFPQLGPWWQIAHAHGIANDSWVAIKRGTPEWQAWSDYFGRIGQRPWFMASQQTITMPARTPDEIPGLP